MALEKELREKERTARKVERGRETRRKITAHRLAIEGRRRKLLI